MIRPDQASLLASLKQGTGDVIRIQAGLRVIGSLCPVTRLIADDEQIVDKLFKWRSANLTRFLTVFNPSKESSRSYLVNFSLGDPARILFLLRDNEGAAVGHIGLCNISSDSVEIDNVMRGEPAEIDYMKASLTCLMHWTFSHLNVKMIFLNVLEDNVRAIRLYRKTGLERVKRIPLQREETTDGYRLIEATTLTRQPYGWLHRMEITRAQFAAR